ncbi:MAG: hypothetical protein F8N15_04965 [Methanobacterium sp.]|nr:hypothetical protein [Methanobacterium sp.]
MKPKVTRIKFCLWCGDPFEMKSPNQKYCSPSRKNCSEEAKRESWRRAANKYRNRYKNVLHLSQVYKIGTGFLSGTPHKDFDKEYAALIKERKRLKLNGLLIGLCPFIQFNFRPFMESSANRGIYSIMESYPYLFLCLVAIMLVIFLGFYYD